MTDLAAAPAGSQIPVDHSRRGVIAASRATLQISPRHTRPAREHSTLAREMGRL